MKKSTSSIMRGNSMMNSAAACPASERSLRMLFPHILRTNRWAGQCHARTGLRPGGDVGLQGGGKAVDSAGDVSHHERDNDSDGDEAEHEHVLGDRHTIFGGCALTKAHEALLELYEHTKHCSESPCRTWLLLDADTARRSRSSPPPS